MNGLFIKVAPMPENPLYVWRYSEPTRGDRRTAPLWANPEMVMRIMNDANLTMDMRAKALNARLGTDLTTVAAKSFREKNFMRIDEVKALNYQSGEYDFEVRELFISTGRKMSGRELAAEMNRRYDFGMCGRYASNIVRHLRKSEDAPKKGMKTIPVSKYKGLKDIPSSLLCVNWNFDGLKEASK